MGQKKTLIFIIDGGFPYGKASANYFRNLTSGLKSFYQIKIWLPVNNFYNHKYPQQTTRKGNYQNIEYIYFGPTIKTHTFFRRGLVRFLGAMRLLFNLLLYANKKNTSCLIKYKADFSFNFWLLTICKIKGIKFINVISEFYDKPKKGVFRLINWYDFYLGIRYLSKKANGLILFSWYLENYFIHLKYKRPVTITPNAIDPEYFMQKEESSKSADTLFVGAIGTSLKKDGIDDLVQSFCLIKKTFNSVQLKIIGDHINDKSFIPLLREKAVKYGIDHCIIFTGLVNYADIPALLHSCDILVLTRPNGVFAEAGFPTKLGEYMACKRPIVVTNVGDLGNYFNGKDIVRLVEAGNISSIADGVLFLLKNKDKRDQLGNAGFDWMMNNLEYNHVAKKVDNFLKCVVISED